MTPKQQLQQYRDLVGLQQLALRDLRDSMTKYVLPQKHYLKRINNRLKEFEEKLNRIEAPTREQVTIKLAISAKA
jgi:hypothetical protein